MNAIAQRGHAAMMWLLGLGLLSAWAAFDQPPRVLETSWGIVHRCAGTRESSGQPGDPLAELTPGLRGPLVQYRHVYMHSALINDPGMYGDQLRELETMPVQTVLELGRSAVARAEQPGLPLAKRDLTLGSLRSSLGRLETWFAKSHLSPSATLLDVHEELACKVQIPGTQQAIDVKHCTGFVGIGIMVIYLYLTSLLGTLASLPRDEESSDRGWILVHRAPLGPALLVLWLVLPAATWLFEHVLIPIDQRNWPSQGGWLLAGGVVASMLAALRNALAARRLHLPHVPRLTVADDDSQLAA